MNRRIFVRSGWRRAVTLFGFVSAATATACSEKLDAGVACPLLCPPTQEVVLKDTVIEAVVVDSTLQGYPDIGEETRLLLAARGDTLDTRVIFRFDTLNQTYTHTATPADSIITTVDSAQLQVVVDTTTINGIPKVTAPFTLELYDVDAATDTVAAELVPLFTPGRLLGSRPFAAESLKDTLRIPVSNNAVLDRIKNGTHLRLGMRLVSATSTQLLMYPSTSLAATLRFKPASDTTLSVSLISKTPSDTSSARVRGDLADFVIVAKAPAERPPLTIAAGGTPARRTYMRFDLPAKILDSSTVVRASLLLTQFPKRDSPSAGDSVAIYAVPITAAPVVTDVRRLLSITSPALASDSLRVRPADSGVRRLELVSLVRVWASTNAATTQRSIALTVGPEGLDPAEAVFFSSKADAALRPRLQLTYVPRVTLGLP